VTIETKGLPQNLDAEKLVLGSILLDDTRISEAPQLRPEDFSIAKHRIIFRCMLDMHERSEPIDRVTLANNLINSGQLQSCDGLTYLVSLDEGLPRLVNFNSYGCGYFGTTDNRRKIGHLG
jgi:replicative DNA helicase